MTKLQEKYEIFAPTADNNYRYQLAFCVDENKSINLLKYLINKNILIENKDNTVYSAERGIPDYLFGNTLESEVAKALIDNVSFIVKKRKEEFGKYDFREIINIFQANDNRFRKKLEQDIDNIAGCWKSEIKNCLAEESNELKPKLEELRLKIKSVLYKCPGQKYTKRANDSGINIDTKILRDINKLIKEKDILFAYDLIDFVNDVVVYKYINKKFINKTAKNPQQADELRRKFDRLKVNENWEEQVQPVLSETVNMILNDECTYPEHHS